MTERKSAMELVSDIFSHIKFFLISQSVKNKFRNFCEKYGVEELELLLIKEGFSMSEEENVKTYIHPTIGKITISD